MKSLAELERADDRAAFVDSAMKLMIEKASSAAREREIGQNDGPCQVEELTAWFESARW